MISDKIISLRASLKSRVLWCISKCLLFSSSCWKHQGFSCFYHENLLGLLEVKSRKVWEPHKAWPLGVLTSQTCPHWASSNSSFTVQVFLLHRGSFGDSAHEFMLWCIVIFYICLSASPVLGGSSLPSDWSSLVDIREAIFSLLNFFLLCEWEWWLPNALHARLETRSYQNVLYS